MKIIGVYIFVLLLPICSLAQRGYLGARNSFEIEIYNSPSFKKTTRLNRDETKTTTRNQFAFTCYALNYSRVMDKNVELSFRYRFANARIPLFNSMYYTSDTIFTYTDPEHISQKRLNFLEEPSVQLHFFSFDFKFYFNGSIAPVGKYLGLNFEHGRGVIKTTDGITVGKGNVAETDNIFIKKQSIIESQKVFAPKQLNGTIFGTYLLAGRTYPINDFLLFTVGLKFPILSVVNVNGQADLGRPASSTDEVYFTENTDFRTLLFRGLGKYSRTALNVGLKVTF